MRTLLIIITASLICLSCGVKSKPEYESANTGKLTVSSSE